MDDQADLVFINASNPTHFWNQNVRRTVRRRAMRDIGKTRRKAKNPPAVTFAWQPVEPPVRCLDSYPRPWPGGIDSDPRARELIHFSMYLTHIHPGGLNVYNLTAQCTPTPSTITDHSEKSGSQWR